MARLQQLAAYRAQHLSGDEKGEAQVFLERLFQAFGHAGYAEAGAKLEMRIKARDTGAPASPTWCGSRGCWWR